MSEPIRFGRLPVVLLLLCSACDGFRSRPRPEDLPPGTTSQAAIEYAALDKPFPRYPTRSLENGAAGVAVASIVVGFDGRIERVDVLEAPDADIAEALRDALERWVLPVHPSGPARTAATMVFYFLIEAGEGRVVSGPWLAWERTGGGRSVAGGSRRIDEAELEFLLETGGALVVAMAPREQLASGRGGLRSRLSGIAPGGGRGFGPGWYNLLVRDYDPQTIEQKWQRRWRERRAFEVTADPARPKFYCLVMFAYPSGHAHVGHVRNYMIGDVVARMKRDARVQRAPPVRVGRVRDAGRECRDQEPGRTPRPGRARTLRT